MKKCERDELAKRVVHYYCDVVNRSSKLTWDHFKREGFNHKLIRRIISRFEKEGRVVTSCPPGRSPIVSTPRTLRKVEALLEKNPEISVRDASAKLNISKSTYHYIKDKKLGIKSRKKEPIPKYNGDQAERARKNCRKVYRRLSESPEAVLIMDDETYVMVDPANIPGNDWYSCRDKENIEPAIRFKPKEKFAQKYLVWQAIDQFGNVTPPFVSKGTMNAQIYLENCLKQILLPFIQKNHPGKKIIFWPDLASCHYQREVVLWLRSNDINIIERSENPPNVPQARPIELFWSICKQKYKKRKSPVKNLRSFKMIWTGIAKKVALEHGQNLMSSMRSKILKIAKNGVFGV